jgi:excisionase family DNA binding protein
MKTPALTVQEAAALLRIHPETLRRAISRGELPATRRGNVFCISPADLEAYFRARGGGVLFP